MATIAVAKASHAGATLSFAAASGGGDTLPNDGNTVLHVKNADAGSHIVTVHSTGKCDQGFTHDDVVTVAAGATKIIGPFDVKRFGRSISVTYDGVTSVTVAAVSS